VKRLLVHRMESEFMAHTAPIYNSRLMKLYTAYLGAHYPGIDVDRLLKDARFAKIEVDDPGHWFNQEQVDLFHQKIVEATGDAHISREVGRYAAFSNAVGVIKQHVLGLLNISSIYLLIARFYPLISRGALVNARKMSPTKAEIIVTPAPGVHEKFYQCDNRLGMFESLTILFTGKYATVTHDQCLHRGDPCCHYEVTWEEPRHLFWKRLMWGGLAAELGFLLIVPRLIPWTIWPLLTAAGLAGVMGLCLYAGHLERQELKRTIQNQGNVAEEHIKEVDYRYRGALLIQKIGQATSELLDLNELAQVMVSNIQDYLDFDRGVVMLADEDRHRLVYAAGFGFDEAKTNILRKTSFRLDKPIAQGIFIKAFREQRPIFVDDVGALQATFSVRSQNFAKQIGSKSLICIPIVYENQSLGILAVDNIKGQRQLAQTDVHLLMGVAYQAAVSIFSAKSYTKLQASEERYRGLYHNAPTPYFSLSTQNATILNCNLAATRLLGLARTQLLGSRWLDYFSDDPGNRARSQWIYDVLQKGGSIHHEEVKLVRRDGQAVWADLSMEPYKDAQGEVLEGRCVLIDTSERKRLEEKLRQAQKMEVLGTLAGGVAHDLSNILTAIVSYPDLLLMDVDDDSPLFDPLNKIRDAGLRAAAIVQDLLTLARLGVRLTDVIDFNVLILEFLKSPEFENLRLRHPDVHVMTDLDNDLLPIRGSAVHLIKTLLNIVSNAAEAMPEGGNIHIVTKNQRLDADDTRKDKKAGRYVAISIKDNGEGIAREDIGRIFEPFFTKKVMGRSGTGLGMAIVWATVQDHKGHIDVESEIGQGTTVNIFLPATQDVPARPPAVPMIEALMGDGEIILVVDDEAEHREIAAKMLTRLGYRVLAADSAQAALTQVQRQPADLLILDMMLGMDMDGLALYRRILSLRPNQKAVITSGYAETYRVKQALELGAGAYIKKPYALKEIAAAVRNELDRPAKVTTQA
jgi:PAS domain S-box-containing protein